MSVVEKEKIDGMAITEDKKGLKLFISDHLDWEDEYSHLLILQDKINAYIGFCENNQYREVYQDVKIQYGVFEIHFLYEPTENAIKFLNRVQNQVTELGIMLECHISERVPYEN